MKNKLQKFLSLLLVLCAAITISAGNITQGSFQNGGSWKISETGELYVDVETVPDYRETLVTQMEGQGCIWNLYWPRTKAPWGNYSDRITSIRFSNKIKNIGENAFAGLNKVKKVSFDEKQGANVKIGSDAFACCLELKNFDFTYVTEIGTDCFFMCNFDYVELPAITKVGRHPFRGCEGLAYSPAAAGALQIPAIVLTGNQIPQMANTFTDRKASDRNRTANCDVVFDAVGYQTNVIVPVSLENQVPEKVAESCEKWGTGGKLSIPRTNSGFMTGSYTPRWAHYDYYFIIYTGSNPTPNFTSASATPWYAYRLTTYQATIRATDTIGAYTFANFEKLHYITGISKGIHAINSHAFYNCKVLEKIDLSNIKTFGESAFEGCSKLNVVHFSKDLKNIGANAFANCNLTDVYVYGECPAVNSAAFGSNVSSIKLHVPAAYVAAYRNTLPWKNMNIKVEADFPVSGTNPTWEIGRDGILKISSNIPNYSSASEQPWYGYHEFIGKIELSESVTSVGNYAFASTGSLGAWSVEAPSVTTIGSHAFAGNAGLRRFTGENVRTINDEAFAGCAALEDVDFGDKLTSLGSRVFDGCPAMENFALDAITPPSVNSQTFVGMGASASGAPGRKAKASGSGQQSVTLSVPEEATVNYLAAPYWNLFSMEFIEGHGAIVKSGAY